MKRDVKFCLLEALRRYHSFHAGKPPTTVWTGLGTPTTYRSVVNLGYMVPTSRETPRIVGWYKLTEAGVATLMQLANEGYRVRDYKVEKGA